MMIKEKTTNTPRTNETRITAPEAPPSTEIRCKFCNSKKVIKYGHFKNTQRYWCKNCQRKFTNNNALPGMKTPTHQVCYALGLYYKGMSLNAISKKIDKKHDIYFSDSTIYKWIEKFAQKGLEDTKAFCPQVGDTWIAKESGVKVCSTTYTILDIIDSESFFLLASICANSMDVTQLKTFTETAKNKARKLPKNVIILSNNDQANTIEIAYNPNIDNIHLITFDKDQSIIMSKRFFSSFCDRNKVISSLKKKSTIQKILDGWTFHYNYRRIHESLEGKTPSEKAGIKNFTKILPRSLKHPPFNPEPLNEETD